MQFLDFPNLAVSRWSHGSAGHEPMVKMCAQSPAYFTTSRAATSVLGCVIKRNRSIADALDGLGEAGSCCGCRTAVRSGRFDTLDALKPRRYQINRLNGVLLMIYFILSGLGGFPARARTPSSLAIQSWLWKYDVTLALTVPC